MDTEQRIRIGMIQGSFMVSAAVMIDLIQFVTKFFHAIPIIGNGIALATGFMLSITAMVGFLLWFRLNDVKFFDRVASKLILWGGSAVIELTPIINALPMWTVAVVCTLLIVRYEDIQYNKKQRELVQNTAAQLRERLKRIKTT